MQETSILSREEFQKRGELTTEEIDRWLKLGLLVPIGKTAGKVAFFSPAQVESVRKIRTLLDLGYDEKGIAKIIRSVGLPSPDDVQGVVPQKLRTIGELAQACDVNSRTIKHWEDKDLLEPDARSEGGFRLYGPAGVERCNRILDLQNIGYTLEQIRAKLELLEDTEALSKACKLDLDLGVLERLTEQNTNLKERIEIVRSSAKRLDELVKRRGKMVSGLRSFLSKQQKNQK